MGLLGKESKKPVALSLTQQCHCFQLCAVLQDSAGFCLMLLPPLKFNLHRRDVQTILINNSKKNKQHLDNIQEHIA